LRAEANILRRCTGWLEELGLCERVVVNLRLEIDLVTGFVGFDAARVRRVLGRITADLERAGQRSSSGLLATATEEQDAFAWYRRQLAEPPAQAVRLSPREERNALRAKAGLPPI
jgi:hypothetical protein